MEYALVQNQIKELPKHYNVVKNLFKDAQSLALSIAYITNGGINLLLGDIKKIVENGGEVRIICDDSEATHPQAIKKLLDVGAQIKVYKPDAGILHTKIWLVKKDNTWHCLIGSANCTKSALFDNVEASVSFNVK
ncbi:MAG TPA: phospholipase D-like domain-containing protein, partial [Elusimicrobiales bacterium]|nr:phospholipase D-like domain-containing protein [Elusimicrobiales bacterium]